ncbi:MAG: single-stranded DNA-binding protein [Muribaculaceae bacterium]|nr:single-stranded DNA-binding protein [Muribaculaceae bacterium]
MSVNKVILLGNVGRDPEVRYPTQGQTVASFPLATSDRAYTTSSGTQVPERTEWHNLVMWGRNAEVAEKYIRKGTRLYVEGRLRTRNYEDRNKIKRYVTEIYVDSFEMLGGGQRTNEPGKMEEPAAAAQEDN